MRHLASQLLIDLDLHVIIYNLADPEILSPLYYLYKFYDFTVLLFYTKPRTTTRCQLLCKKANQ